MLPRVPHLPTDLLQWAQSALASCWRLFFKMSNTCALFFQCQINVNFFFSMSNKCLLFFLWISTLVYSYVQFFLNVKHVLSTLFMCSVFFFQMQKKMFTYLFSNFYTLHLSDTKRKLLYFKVSSRIMHNHPRGLCLTWCASDNVEWLFISIKSLL